MKSPENWSQLSVEVADLAVAPAQELRIDSSGALQYVQDGTEYLAFRSLEPYGTETENAFKVPRPAHLLEATRQGADYTIFTIPEEVLALQALTQGTGMHRAELLGSVYYDIGKMLGYFVEHPKVLAPLVQTRDIALDRSTGETLLIPPLSFGQRSHTASEYLETFLGSIGEDLDELWPREATDFVKSQVTLGAEDVAS
jgi:hypothetical protein